MLYVLYTAIYLFKKNHLRSELTYETLLEVANKLELSENEKEEAEELPNKIKERLIWNI